MSLSDMLWEVEGAGSPRAIAVGRPGGEAGATKVVEETDVRIGTEGSAEVADVTDVRIGGAAPCNVLSPKENCCKIAVTLQVSSTGSPAARA